MRRRWSTIAAVWFVTAKLLNGADASSSVHRAPGDSLSLEAYLALVLEKSRAIQTADARRKDAAGGVLLVAGAFDPGIEFSMDTQRPTHIPAGGVAPVSTQRTYSVSLQQAVAGGIQLQPWAGYRPESIAQGGEASFGFNVRMSLLRLFERDATRFQLRAARFVAASAEQAHQHTTSVELLRAAAAYWEMVAAVERYEIMVEAERRARDLQGRIARLVEAGERAAVDAEQTEAFLADRVTRRTEAAQTLWEAAGNLALPADLQVDVVHRTTLSTPMPGVANRGLQAYQPSIPAEVVERPDVAVARLVFNAETMLLQMRSVDLLPHVLLSVGYGHWARDASFGESGQGFLSFGVHFRTSPYNRSARGAMERQRARHAELRAQLDMKVAGVDAAMVITREAVANAREEVLSALRAERAHRRAVEGEREKLTAGVATVFDVILAEDRLTMARLQESASRLRHAVALGTFAFEAGRLSVPATRSGEGVLSRIRNVLQGEEP